MTFPARFAHVIKKPKGLNWEYQVAGANRRWRLQFRYRGSRHESAVAQLFSLGLIAYAKNYDYWSRLVLGRPVEHAEVGGG